MNDKNENWPHHQFRIRMIRVNQMQLGEHFQNSLNALGTVLVFIGYKIVEATDPAFRRLMSF